jgi:hypothetical protein
MDTQSLRNLLMPLCSQTTNSKLYVLLKTVWFLVLVIILGIMNVTFIQWDYTVENILVGGLALFGVLYFFCDLYEQS